jgi:CDP-diacylglycerol---glycerol-3-phosphate 3-phosphatidyltransferase
MSVTTEKAAGDRPASGSVMNVPNQLTTLRLVLAIVLFVLIDLRLFLAGAIVFVVAASTDWLDGYWARKYGQVTKLGRVFDPFVDKLIICGTFIYLASLPGSGLAAWMAVVVVGRELMVTALRSFIEHQGGDFSAKLSGKLKMLLQCVAAGLSLYGLTWYVADQPPEKWGRPDWLVTVLPIAVWAAVVTTIYSGLDYLLVAGRVLRESRWTH